MPTPAVSGFLDDFSAELQSRFAAVKPRKLKPNLTSAELTARDSLRRREDIVILRADKNLGSVAMNTTDYELMGLEMLNQSHVKVR
ncbi:hypothetical protein N9L31_00020 [bacterium]|nr:hypothetical protein [bacterium]